MSPGLRTGGCLAANSAGATGHLALTLLMARIRAADHHDATVAPNDLAVIANALNARLDLHE